MDEYIDVTSGDFLGVTMFRNVLPVVGNSNSQGGRILLLFLQPTPSVVSVVNLSSQAINTILSSNVIHVTAEIGEKRRASYIPV